RRFCKRYIGVLFLNVLVMKGQKNKNSDKYQVLYVQYEKIKNENSKVSHKNETLNGKVERINNELDETSTEFTKYQKKMKPYEAMEEADAKKTEANMAAAQKVTDKVNGLPPLNNLKLDDKDKVASAQQAYDALTDEQKKLVDISKIGDLNDKFKELEVQAQKDAEKAAQEKAQKEKEEKEAAEAEKKRKEEEAKGYETGITYDQLARTPDDYDYKKVKFYGKVIQVIEGDDTTEIRFAVDDDYNQVI